MKAKKLYRELKGIPFGQTRIGHIGASDIGAIMGCGFKSPFQWVVEKKAELQNGAQEQERVLLFEMGHSLENLIAEQFIIEHPEYKLDKGFEKDRVFERTDHPLFHCTPDRFLNNKSALLELKYDSTGKYYYNSPTDFEINEGYLWQCQYQMWFFNINKCWLYGITNHGNSWSFLLHRSDKYSKIIEERVPEFWERYVIGDEEPEITDVRDCSICKVEHTPIMANKDILDAIERITFIEMQVNKLKDSLMYDNKECGYEALKNKVKLFMGKHDQLVDENGNELATYRKGLHRVLRIK